MTVPEADRERTIAHLREQMAEGRLDLDEYGVRLDEAYQDVSVEELQHALRELPVPPLVAPAPPPQAPPPPAAAPAARPRPPASPAPMGVHHPHAGKAAHIAWKTHLGTYLSVNLMLVMIWLLTMPGGYFWPIWPMMGWGVGLASHGFAYSASRSRR
jgi:uncharacterized membrane protein